MTEPASKRPRKRRFEPTSDELDTARRWRAHVLGNRETRGGRLRRSLKARLVFTITVSLLMVVLAQWARHKGIDTFVTNALGWVLGFVTHLAIQLAYRRRASVWDDDAYVAEERYFAGPPSSYNRSRLLFNVIYLFVIGVFFVNPSVASLIVGVYGGYLVDTIVLLTRGPQLVGYDFEASLLMARALREEDRTF